MLESLQYTLPATGVEYLILDIYHTLWRHQMETFSALLAICAGNSPVTGEFPTQRPVTRSFDVYFDLCPNERLSKQSWGWWFETLSRSLWRHRNDTVWLVYVYRFCEFLDVFVWGYMGIFLVNPNVQNTALWLNIAPPSSDTGRSCQLHFDH